MADEEDVARDAVQKDLTDLKGEAGNYSPKDIKDGSWFVRFLAYALENYAETVDAEYFQRKYPGLPVDAVVDRQIALAKKYSAIEGALSAGAYSAAVAATIGTGGGASPVALPAAGVSFVADMFYTTRLQLRLAYDMSVLYGCPADLQDAEDVADLIKVAFGIKAGEAFRSAISRLSPEATRQGVRAMVQGSTLAWLRALPVVGKYLLQRNVIKFAIPVVAVPINAMFNSYSTGSIADAARRTYRDKAAIREFAGKVHQDVGDAGLLILKALLLVIQADGEVSAEESWVLKDLTELYLEQDDGEEIVETFSDIVALNTDEVLEAVGDSQRELKAVVYRAACHVAAVDHKIHRKELAILKRLADACGQTYDARAIKALV